MEVLIKIDGEEFTIDTKTLPTYFLNEMIAKGLKTHVKDRLCMYPKGHKTLKATKIIESLPRK